MKTFRLLSMAAAALMMAACSNEQSELEAPKAHEAPAMRFAATIGAPAGNDATRTEYDESSKGRIYVAWNTGDEVALIHNGVKDVVKVEAVDDRGNATIEGTITPGTNGEDVALVYPAAAVDATGSGTGFTPNADYAQKALAQQGTLDYIAANLDARQGSGTMAVSGSSATLSDNVAMASQIAIWKLMPNVSTRQLTVMSGATPVAATTAIDATKTIYLALPPLADASLKMDAVSGSDTYTYSKEGVTLEAGKYYQSAVTMTIVVIPLTSITLNRTTATINKGGTTSLSVKSYEPDNATYKSVNWSSSNTAVATVSSSGRVTAKGGGTAVITATATDGGGAKASCTVTVKVPVTGITLNKTATEIAEGNTETLTATVAPADASNKGVSWSSGNTDVATVSSSGKVTAKSVGTAVITATANDGSGVKATCTVTVKATVNTGEVNISGWTEGTTIGGGKAN